MFRPFRKSRRLLGPPSARRVIKKRWPALEIEGQILPVEDEEDAFRTGRGGELGLALEDLGDEENMARLDTLEARIIELESVNRSQTEALDFLLSTLRSLTGGPLGALNLPTTKNVAEVSVFGGRPFKAIQTAIDFLSSAVSSTEPGFVLVHPGQYTEKIDMASDVYVMSVVPRIPDLVEITQSDLNTTTFTTVDFNGISRCGLVGIKISNTRNDSTNTTYCVRFRGSYTVAYLVDFKINNSNTTVLNSVGVSDENTNASGTLFLGEAK